MLYFQLIKLKFNRKHTETAIPVSYQLPKTLEKNCKGFHFLVKMPASNTLSFILAILLFSSKEYYENKHFTVLCDFEYFFRTLCKLFMINVYSLSKVFYEDLYKAFIFYVERLRKVFMDECVTLRKNG